MKKWLSTNAQCFQKQDLTVVITTQQSRLSDWDNKLECLLHKRIFILVQYLELSPRMYLYIGASYECSQLRKQVSFSNIILFINGIEWNKAKRHFEANFLSFPTHPFWGNFMSKIYQKLSASRQHSIESSKSLQPSTVSYSCLQSTTKFYKCKNVYSRGLYRVVWSVKIEC